MEWTCIWKKRVSWFERYQLYFVGIVECLLRRRGVYVGGAYAAHVAHFQMRAMPNLVYRGPRNTDGMEVWVYTGRWHDLLRRFVTGLVTETSLYRRWSRKRLASESINR